MVKTFEEWLTKSIKIFQDTKEKREKQPLTDEQKRERAHLIRLLNADFSDMDLTLTIKKSM